MREAPVGASIQRLRHVSRWPFLSFLRNRDHVVEPRGSTDEVAFRFKECEGDCGHPLRRSRRKSMSVQNISSAISFY